MDSCKDKVRLAHAAGIFDVRGSILLQKRYNAVGWRTLEVRLTGIEKIWSVMDYLKEEFDGTITGYSPAGGHTRKCWVLTGQKAQDFLAEIEPYLKNEKRKKLASFIRRRYRVRQQTGPQGFSNRETNRRQKMETDWVAML